MTMLDYYTLQTTLDKLSTAQNTHTPNDIATLCRAGKLTPLFAYNRFATLLIPFHPNEGGYYFDEDYITQFNGYLTHTKALELLDGYSNSIILASAFVYQAEGYDTGESLVLLDEDTANIGDQSYLAKPIEITQKQLLFPREEVEALASNTQSGQPNLEPMHPRERNTAIKIMYALLIKSGLDNTAPTSQNAGSANCEIRTLLDQLDIPVGHETIGKFLTDVKDLAKQHPLK